MRPLIEHARTRHTPETLAEQLRAVPGLMLLRSDGEVDRTSALFVCRRAAVSHAAHLGQPM